MKSCWPAVVATDLDGTLLSSRDYSFREAVPALEALRQRNIPVVLVSSKTRAEMEMLREQMGLVHPFIVENGGAAYVPGGYFGEEAEELQWGAPYRKLVAALDEARRQTGARIKAFSDLDVEAVARMTGLDLQQAARAKQRQFDEPFWFEGQVGEEQRAEVLERLEARGLSVTRGGRFYHVMGSCDKGRALQELFKRYGACPSAGIGDAHNDLSFLRLVDRPYIVAGPDGRHDLALVNALDTALRVGPAPAGWAEAIRDFLSWLDISGWHLACTWHPNC